MDLDFWTPYVIGNPLLGVTRIPKQAGVLRRRPAGQKRETRVQIALRYVLNEPHYRVLNALFVICEFHVSTVEFYRFVVV